MRRVRPPSFMMPPATRNSGIAPAKSKSAPHKTCCANQDGGNGTRPREDHRKRGDRDRPCHRHAGVERDREHAEQDQKVMRWLTGNTVDAGDRDDAEAHAHERDGGYGTIHDGARMTGVGTKADRPSMADAAPHEGGRDDEQDEIVIEPERRPRAAGDAVAVDRDVLAGDLGQNRADRGRPQEQHADHLERPGDSVQMRIAADGAKPGRRGSAQTTTPTPIDRQAA